jgi:hypothetical protein
MSASGMLWRIWYWIRWPLLVLAIAYAALVVYRTKYFFDQDKIAADVAAIHANKLTREDVFGPLPPVPNPVENEKTLAGIDANANGIRDDVEISIYNAHKGSAKVTAAMLQYAKALQMEFTRVYNSETLVAVIQEQARGSLCILEDERILEVENLILNNEMRRQFRQEISDKYMTSYSLPSPQGACDISV